MTFVIDTGADISLSRMCKDFEGEPFNPEQICKLAGITKKEIYSLGAIDLELSLPNEKCKHSLQLVNLVFPIAAASVNGIDFLQKYLSKIDYETFTIFIY